MPAVSPDPPSSSPPLSNDTLPYEMGGDARVQADAAKPMADLPTIGHIGRYVLKFKVGQGGLGTVLAAYDPLLSRLIAIKTVSPRVGTEERESFNTHFLNEARAAAGLSHPNIVTVFDAGVSPQGAYIAMELLKGRDLRQMREDGSRPTPAQAALIVRRVADALSYAHARGVVHCDVKPANIFMVSPTQPKVLDFGIARIMVPSTGERGKQIGGGSPRYMAPEQLRGEPTDRRSDVFSLGVVLYELLTDSNPFARPTLPAITQAVVDHNPPLASLVDPNVPLALAAIVARAMEKDPAARYQSARVFSRDLRRWLEGQLEGSQGRDTGTDPVGLTQPGVLSVDNGLGTRTAPGAPVTDSAAEPGSTFPGATTSPTGSPARTTRDGTYRGWTVTGLASIAVIAAMGAVWLGDAGIGPRPASQQIGHPPATSDLPGVVASTSGQAQALAPQAPGNSVAAGRAGNTEHAEARAIEGAPTASQPVIDAGATAASAPESAPGSEQIITEAVTASTGDGLLPTVRLQPRVRENPVEGERATGARRPIPTSREARDADSRDGSRDSPRDNHRESARETRMAPVSTAVPARLGFVEVRAIPSAEIEIDGNRWGSAAPFARLRMTEGTHVITLHRDGFTPRRMKVVVVEGKPVQVAHNFGR